MENDFAIIELAFIQDVAVDGVADAVELPDGRVHVTLYAWSVVDGRPAKIIVAKYIRPLHWFTVREMLAQKRIGAAAHH